MKSQQKISSFGNTMATLHASTVYENERNQTKHVPTCPHVLT